MIFLASRSFIENIQFAFQKDILGVSRNVMEWLNVKKCTEEEGRKRQKYKKLLASDERSSMTLSAA